MGRNSQSCPLFQMPGDLDVAVQKALAAQPWGRDVTLEQVAIWQRKLQSIKSEFQLEEVLHYVTLEQVQQGTVPSQPEYDYLVSQYQPALTTSQPLQSPEQTFGEKIATRPCPRCHSRDTSFYIVQLRAADEASQPVFFCSSCHHSWKYK